MMRKWYFSVEDGNGDVECVGINGETIDENDARDSPFRGTEDNAYTEAIRRVDLWETRNNCLAAKVIYHSMGAAPDMKETPKMTKTENTIADANTGEMRCLICGDAVPIPLGRVDWVVTVMRAFTDAHRDCDGRPGRTQMSRRNKTSNEETPK